MTCNQKDKKPEIEKENLASTNSQFQETQGQGTSNLQEHIQNQEQQFLQSIDFYQDANNFIRSNQSNERDLSGKIVNNLIPETNNNLCNFNNNAQDQRLPNYINRADQQPDSFNIHRKQKTIFCHDKRNNNLSHPALIFQKLS